jgi:pimeloyl-ACP methyl ester carboxylesterase
MPKAYVNGININYKVQGGGESLVLIMGYSGDKTGWMFQTRAFKRHFRVVTFDNRGVGRSDKPPGAYSMKMMADDTVGLMEHLGIDKAHILGVSMGGMIAQELAINYPERVNKLILGCTAAGRSELSGISPEFPKGLGLSDNYTDDEVRGLPIIKVVDHLYSSAFNKCLYRTFLITLAKIQVRLSGTTGLIGQLEAVLGHDTFDRLPAIQAPTLVMAGTGDRIIMPSSSEVLANGIPDARLIKFEGGSHSFFIEMRGEFNREVLGFLGS